MRVQLLSDIHLEFYTDHGRAFVDSLDPSGVDVLALAGDVSVSPLIREALGLICRRYSKAQVLFVAGNHEFYHGSPEQTKAEVAKAVEENPNLVVLDNTQFEYQGIRFAGTSLWFPDDPLNAVYKHWLSDFAYIKDFEPWVYNENRLAQAFLRDDAKGADVIITHHIPSDLAIAPKWKGNNLNRFFVCDMTDMIMEAKPSLWFFGHTHDPGEFLVGDTRLITNPRGYPKELRASFNPKLTFDFREGHSSL